MKKLLLLFTACLALGSAPVTTALADGYYPRHHWYRFSGIRGAIKHLKRHTHQNAAEITKNAGNIDDNADNIQRNSDQIDRNSVQLQRNTDKTDNNTADIADNFSQIQDNRSRITTNADNIRDNFLDLESRVFTLEQGSSGGGGRHFVDVDCDANPNALLEPPINGSFTSFTTYQISGACNGPLYVNSDGVRFIGVAPAAAIVLPADTPFPDNGAVFGDGAQDLRIQNLLLDLSAWGTAAAQGSDAAGIYARNAFIRVIDSTIVGGLFSINPFRDGIVLLQGTVNLNDFVNEGISAGDHSVVQGRGQVNISSTRSDGSYLIGADAYRGGNIDFRGGVTINLPPTDPSAGFFPSSVTATSSSHVRIRNNGIIALNGELFVDSASTVNIQGGTLSGDILVLRNAALQLQGIEQTSGFNNVRLNATASVFNSSVQAISASQGGFVDIYVGTLDGANVETGGGLTLRGTSVSADIQTTSVLEFFETEPGVGSLNGNNILICGAAAADIDPAIAATGAVTECPP